MRNIRATCLASIFRDGVTGRALGADKQNVATLGCQAAQIIHRILHQRHGFFEIDDVYLAARPEDVGGHLGIPVTRLMSEMYACLKHLAHTNVGHEKPLHD